jgi:uncharacterized protein (DUF1778 family)
MTKDAKKPVEQRRHAVTAAFRFTVEQDELFRKAADHAGLSMSAWVRERLLAAARKEIGER